MLLQRLWSSLNLIIKLPYRVLLYILMIRGPNWGHPPGPLANWLPFVGSLPLFSFDPSYLVLTKMAKKYGKIFQVKLGYTRLIVICDPDLLREAFNKESFSGRKTPPLMEGMERQGIIQAEGELMRNQRSLIDRVMLNLTFRNEVTRRNFLNRAFDAIEDLMKGLEETGGQPIGIEPQLNFIIVNIIFATLVSAEFDIEDQELMWLINATSNSFRTKELISFANFVPIFANLPSEKQAQASAKERKQAFMSYMMHIVQNHMENLDLENAKDLIDSFLLRMADTNEDDNEFFTETQLYAVLYDIFSTSLETVSASILWLLLAIVKHPNIQDHIQDELNEMVDAFERPRLDHRHEMPYLEATILEGLRYFSILPIGVSHSTIVDTTIGGYHIPSNSMVVGLFWKIHHDPALWKNDPNTFNPTNHLNDRGLLDKSQDLMPFSTGSRSCLGDHVALSVIYLIIANILQRFRIQAEDGAELPSMDDSQAGLYRRPFPYKIRFIRR